MGEQCVLFSRWCVYGERIPAHPRSDIIYWNEKIRMTYNMYSKCIIAEEEKSTSGIIYSVTDALFSTAGRKEG